MGHSLRWIAVVGLSALTPAAGGALVDMALTPGDQVVCTGDVVEIDLVLVSDGPEPQPFDATDAVLSWDPATLLLLGNDDSDADVAWFISGFLPDIDDVNDDTTDGDAIYTALAPLGAQVLAPVAPDSLLVTTLRFEVVGETSLTELELLATIGVFGQSRVLLAGANITGTLGPPAGVTAVASCPADCAVPCDGVVDVLDLLAMLAEWGMAGTPCDIAGGGTVDVVDLLALLAQWGNCP